MFDIDSRDSTNSRMNIRDKCCMEDLSHFLKKIWEIQRSEGLELRK